MTILRKLAPGAVVVAGAALLSGCLASSPGGSGPSVVTPAPTGVEGSWLDAQGTGLSTLVAGSFSTVATDTGQKLADGSYVMTGANAITITGTSLIRQTQISFNCLLANPNQLNCTSASGQQFVLTRRTA